MKLVKFLFKLLIPLVIIGIIIGLPLYLFSYRLTPPTDQYIQASENAFYTEVDGELSALITNPTEDTVEFTITEAFINRVVQRQLSKDNPKYQNPDNAGELAHDYMMLFGNNFGLKGVWTDLTNDALTIYAGADVILNNRPLYQTGFEMKFDIVLSENNEYYLKVNKIKIGKLDLPLQQALSLANWAVSSFAGKTLNEMIAENLSFGDFDSEDISFTVGEEELSSYLYSVDPTFAALLKIIYEEELLILDISDDGFDISLRIGAFRRLLTDPNEPAFTKWEDEDDKSAFMTALGQQALQNAIINPTDPTIDLTEADLNSILDYTLQDKVQFEFPITFEVDETEIEYKFESTNLFVMLADDELSIHITMSLNKTGMAGSFDMQFNLSSNVSMNENGDMILAILDSNIGEIDLDQTMLATIFGVFDPALMVDNTLVIPQEKVNEMFAGSGLEIENSYVLNSRLRLHFGIATI